MDSAENEFTTLQSFFREVAAAVLFLDESTNAHVEYPGVIHVNLGGRFSAMFGTVNEKWDGDVLEIHSLIHDVTIEEPTTLASILTDVPSDSRDAAVISKAIVEAIKVWREEHL